MAHFWFLRNHILTFSLLDSLKFFLHTFCIDTTQLSINPLVSFQRLLLLLVSLVFLVLISVTAVKKQGLDNKKNTKLVWQQAFAFAFRCL